MTLTPLIVLVGSTAVGKSSFALDLADALFAAGQPAEIVNSDSMAVYRGMDIGTAKPSPAELARVPHHLIDIFDITQSASVAEFQLIARQAIDSLRNRGVSPILVGGSALYVRAIIDQFDFPGTDPQVRARWEARLAQVGAPALHAELASQCPSAAEAILPGNGRRIVRALEVVELTGKFIPHIPEPNYALSNVHQFGLQIAREDLDTRIAVRVEQMWQAGLVEEVRGLDQLGLRDCLTASRALGYRQVLAFLAGQISEAEAKQATILGTRRFARKQLGWFQRDPRIDWLSGGRSEAIRHIIETVHKI